MAERRGKPSDEETAFLESYRPGDFSRPSVAVDLVVLTIEDCDLRLLTVQRNEHPFKGKWALPGGFLRVGPSRTDQGEGIDEAARRELHEETGLPEGVVFLEQLRTFGAPQRDPRMRVVSVAYYALVRPTLAPLVRPGGDVRKVRWQSVSHASPLGLAFDHDEIVQVALTRVRDEIDRSHIAFELVPDTFTIQQLRAVHEVVKGSPIDPGNFRKRFLRMIDDGILEQSRGKRLTASKPAQVYRFCART
jgi:8-oxo-dGTP diphosphatase